MSRKKRKESGKKSNNFFDADFLRCPDQRFAGNESLLIEMVEAELSDA
jgi:hypothetical protein